MSSNVHNINDHYEDADELDQDQRELQERVDAAVAIHGYLPPEMLEEVEAMMGRLERHMKQNEEERAGLNALKAAFRPGENLGQLLDWGKAQGLTTMQEIFDARAAEKEVAEWSA